LNGTDTENRIQLGAFIDTGKKRADNTVQIQKNEYLGRSYGDEKEVNRKRCRTYHWWDRRYGGNEEPDDTLKN
jgi:hypothetical protein